MPDLDGDLMDQNDARTGTAGRWSLEIKTAVALAVALLLVVLALSLSGFGDDGRRAVQEEAAPITDPGRVPAAKVVDR